MINITFQGNVFDSTGTKYSGDEVRYQAFFYKVNSNSSPNTWSLERTTEKGQYSINLGDGDWLTQAGNVGDGDKILLLFWTPNSSIRSDNNLVEWSFIEVELSGNKHVYADNVQTYDAQVPNCSFTIAGNRTNTDVIITDIASNNNFSWIFQSTDHFQEAERYSEALFNMNLLPLSSVNIDWDDIIQSGLNPGSNYTHQYTSSGDYNIEITVTNVAGLTCNTNYTHRIYWQVPTADFNISNPNPNPLADTGQGQIVNFTPIINDPDGRFTLDNWSIDWLIDDNGPYGIYDIAYPNNDTSFIPAHQWHNPGPFNVRETLNWWDGFSWQIIIVNKTVTQQVWSISNGLTWPLPVIVDVPTTYTPNIAGSSGYEPWVDYEIDGNPEFVDHTTTETFDWIFTVSDTHDIKQIIHYHDGFSPQTQEENFEVGMHALAMYEHHNTDCGKRFVSTAIPGEGPITEYVWEVIYDGNVIDTGPNDPTFYYAWPMDGSYIVRHTITDSLPTTDSYELPFDGIKCNKGLVTSGGGYITKIEKPPPLPVVKIRLKYADDEYWNKELNQESYIKVELNE